MESSVITKEDIKTFLGKLDQLKAQERSANQSLKDKTSELEEFIVSSEKTNMETLKKI